jgi:hypothetical protein
MGKMFDPTIALTIVLTFAATVAVTLPLNYWLAKRVHLIRVQAHPFAVALRREVDYAAGYIDFTVNIGWWRITWAFG